MYKIYIESIALSDVTAQRLQAIQIAREGVEALENIRNTNWLLYGLDYSNCWNTLNYNNACIGYDPSDIPTPLNTDIVAGSYILYQGSDARWYLQGVSGTPTTHQEYISLYEVWLQDGFYTQSWSFESLTPNFSREIQISYPGWNPEIEMNVKSLVTWKWRQDTPHELGLDLILTNWKN